MPAKNDNAVFLMDRGDWFAGKPRSYRRTQVPAASDPHNHSSPKSLHLLTNPGQSRPCFGQGAACRVFPTRPDRVASDRKAEIRPDE